MAEFKFALKTFGFALAVVLALQIRFSGATLEEHSLSWIRTSPVPKYLQKVADGGALAVRNATKAVTDYTSRAINGSEGQRASRLNLGIERSPAAAKAAGQHRAPSEAEDDTE